MVAATDYIWTRSHKVLSVDDVAENAGMTRRTLERHMFCTLPKPARETIVFTGRSASCNKPFRAQTTLYDLVEHAVADHAQRLPQRHRMRAVRVSRAVPVGTR